jgi:hypothetical protein
MNANFASGLGGSALQSVENHEPIKAASSVVSEHWIKLI